MQRRFLILGVAFCATASLFAQNAADTPLDALLNRPISAAAKYEQSLDDVAASATIISRDEIERFGYTTVAEVLEAIRGFYLSYDRNYTYVGVRGFSRPTDYNNRVLMLIDDHPMTDNVWGATPVGSELVLDLSAVERIEVVRGPSSVLYGTGAVFAVINIVTTQGEHSRPAGIEAAAGSQRSRAIAINASGHPHAASGEVSVVWRETGGQRELYFPEFDAPATNDGIAENRDYDNAHGVLATLTLPSIRIVGYAAARRKGIPTGVFGATFNERSETFDRRAFLDLVYERKVSNRRYRTRASLDEMIDEGVYAGQFDESAHGQWATVEQQLLWDPRPNQRWTFGAEVVRHLKADYAFRGDSAGGFRRQYDVYSAYVQDEFQPTTALTLIAGLRHDRTSYAGRVTSPRLALLIHPRRGRTIKLLAGDAHRVPNTYERYLEDYEGGVKSSADLRSERVRTLEAVWEERLAPSVFATASLYQFKAKGLIEQVLDRDDFLFQYHNAGAASARGVEVQIDYRANHLWSYASYALQRAVSEDEPLSNSPQQLAKAGLTFPLLGRGHAAAELMYDSGRKTLAGDETAAYLGTNVSLTWRLTANLHAKATIRNVFDRSYATPASVEHAADILERDGRTWQLKVGYDF